MADYFGATARAPLGFTAGLVRELDMVGDWGLLTTDAEFNITGWNRWLERVTDRAAESFIGRNLFDVFPSLIARRYDSSYSQALEGRTVILSQRLHKHLLPLPSPAAKPRFEFMQQTARIIPLSDGAAVCGTLTVVEDVTERVVSEAELRERVEALREADRRKDEFLAMLAHELRNPLAPISNAVRILDLAGVADPTVARARDIIGRQAAHLTRLVDDLLDVSRITRGKIHLERVPLDLAAVVRQAVETSRPLLDARRHELTVTVPPRPVMVTGDFVRLAQVVNNLLNNAAKYTDDGGKIWLTVDTDGTREATVRVRDSGRGIDPAVLGSLFDLFFQVDRTLDRTEGGLGIGLALVRSLTEMHGGRVEAHSAGRGKGSEFVLHLPLHREQPTVTAEAAVAPPTAPPLRILVVDDNRDSAESMALLLKLDRHEVWTAHDGHRAVEIALRERPEVVLLDIGLPGLNGYETCRALREGGLHDTVIIAMTGYGQEKDRLVSHEAGFDAHQVKPVELATLRKLLVGRSAERNMTPGRER